MLLSTTRMDMKHILGQGSPVISFAKRPSVLNSFLQLSQSLLGRLLQSVVLSSHDSNGLLERGDRPSHLS